LLLGFENACFEQSILELWAVNGAYTEKSDTAIGNLSKEEIINKINNFNQRLNYYFLNMEK
jgi:hypothetical protein